MPQLHMQVDHDIDQITPYKYLDSLDTVRFRNPSQAVLEGRWLHAYSDFFLALMMGEGIVVPNNQLVDSLPFIDVASQLIESARKNNNTHHLPLRARLYKANSAFEVAQQCFGKVGTKENNFEDRFVLSGWPHLNEDNSRREKWAAIFRGKLSLPEYNSDFFYDGNEYEYAKKLYIVLTFFDSDGIEKRPCDALEVRKIREQEIKEIGYMNAKARDEIFQGMDSGKVKILTSVILIFKKILDANVRVDRRSDIINVLRIGKPKRLNPLYFENIEDPEIVEEAIFTIVDSIYNYSSGIGTISDLINHTEKANSSQSIIPAVLSLAEFDRLTKRKVEGDYVLLMPDGIISPHSIRWEKVLENKDNMTALLDKFSWDTFYQATITEPSWRQSLYEYLHAFQDYRESPKNKSHTLEKKYLDMRRRHMYQSWRALSKEYIQIVDEEWHIHLLGITGVQIETSNVLEKSLESSVSTELDTELKGTIGGEVSAKASLIPEASATTKGSIGAAVTISTGKYGKQSDLTHIGKNMKGEMATILRLKDLQEHYIEQEKVGEAIKGITATFFENIT